MIVVEGIEDAVVGWFERGGRRGVVYSVDRIRINMERDGLNVAEQDEVMLALQKQIEMAKGDREDLPPIVVHSADYDEIVWRDETGNFDT